MSLAVDHAVVVIALRLVYGVESPVTVVDAVVWD